MPINNLKTKNGMLIKMNLCSIILYEMVDVDFRL